MKLIGVPVLVLHPRTGQCRLLQRLTAREQQVAALIVNGKRNREIASELRISLSTVKDHVHHVLTKLQCRSRQALGALLAGQVL